MAGGDKHRSLGVTTASVVALVAVSFGFSTLDMPLGPHADPETGSQSGENTGNRVVSTLENDGDGFAIPGSQPAHAGRSTRQTARFGNSSTGDSSNMASARRNATRAQTGTSRAGPSQPDDDLAMPEWERIITPDGAAVDLVGSKGRQGSNGIPDYLEIYSGIEAGYVEEVISNGVATDSSALLIARDVSDEVLYNGAVRPEHDLGNAFYLLDSSPGGHLRIYIGVERLLSEFPSFIEFEFNQNLIHVGSGIPWWEIKGGRRDEDLLVRFNLVAGRLMSVELALWRNGGYHIFETDTDGLGTGCKDKFSYIFCMGAPPLDRSNQVIEVWDSDYIPVEPTLADSFAELGLDLDRLALPSKEFSGVYIRTPEDVVLASFRAIGNSAGSASLGLQ